MLGIMAKDAEAEFIVSDLIATLQTVGFEFGESNAYAWMQKLVGLHLAECSRVDRTRRGRPRVYYKISPEGLLAVEEVRTKIQAVFGPL